MAFTYNYRMLSGLEGSGGKNIVWAEADAVADFASVEADPGSIGTIRGDSNSLYLYNGTEWLKVDKTNIAALRTPVEFDGIDPYTLLMSNKLMEDVVRRVTLNEENLTWLNFHDTLTASNAATGISLVDAMVGAPMTVVAKAKHSQAEGDPSYAAPKAITAKSVKVKLDAVEFALSPALYGGTTVQDSVSSSGTVTRYHKVITLTGAEAGWTSGEAGAPPYVLTLADKKAGTTNFYCSHSKAAASGTTADTCVGHAANPTVSFNPPSGNDYDTLTEWKAKLSAKPFTLVYELATPVTETFAAVDIRPVTAKVLVTHDGGGDLTLTYRKDLNVTVPRIYEIAAAAPTKEADMWAGKLLFNTTDSSLSVCTTPGEQELDTLTVSDPCGTAGDVTVTLNEVGVDVTLANNDTKEQVAGKIRATTFEGWTTGGSGAVVTFLKDAAGEAAAPTYTVGSTGAAATFARTNQGVDAVWGTLINAS